MYERLFTYLLTHLFVHVLSSGHPVQPPAPERLQELASIVQDVISTDATEDEAYELLAVSIHETRAHVRAHGRDGSRGAFQVRPPAASYGALEALRRLRWSERACGAGDLSLYAGCGQCGKCPEIVQSLLDPSLPRR
jgi:hypothetical protein